MWRFLTGLNKSDLTQEIQRINPDLKKPYPFNNEQSFVKATDISDSQLRAIKKLLANSGEIIIESATNEENRLNVIFSVSPNSMNQFSKKIIDQKSDELVPLANLLQNISKDSWSYQCRNVELKIDQPIIMGILNITPDSFSDGGKYFNEDQAFKHATEMSEAGANIIDIGGESTRPESKPVSIEEEWQRISNVINKLLNINQIIISVDTYKSEIARRALDMGVHIINDISGLTFDPEMGNVISEFRVPVILMHIKGTPRDMQKNPLYQNLMDEVYQFFLKQSQLATAYGIEQIIVDLGIGFGKRPQDNFELIRRLGEFKALGYPILLGASRKSFIGFGLQDSQKDRKIGSITSVVCGILNGANLVRVHDVDETKQALQMVKEVLNSKAIT